MLLLTPPPNASAGRPFVRPLSRLTQQGQNTGSGKPIPKLAAEAQAAGEAVYAFDTPPSRYTLYGSFIYGSLL